MSVTNTRFQMSVQMSILLWTSGNKAMSCGKRAETNVLTRLDRGTRFTLSRDELLTLPEFVLLSLFPNGLLPDGHLNAYHEGDAFQVDVREIESTCRILQDINVT